MSGGSEVSRITIGRGIEDLRAAYRKLGADDDLVHDVLRDFCTALGLAPDTLVCNLHALAPNEHVVRASKIEVIMDASGERGVLDLRCFNAHVVREAVVPATPEGVNDADR